MKKFRIYLILLLLIAMTAMPAGQAFGAGDQAGSADNRYNVVVVLDASNSMNYTDPDGLRYEAIGQFVSLLAEEGNVLGGVVFSTNVEASSEPVRLSGTEGKTAAMDFFESTGTYSYTNIGAALDTAVNMIQNSGSPDLPSVILFLSDGNSEMPTDEELTQSLDLKADAIQRARDAKIRIYNVCLNANGKADTSEMDQISKATDGRFEEVKTPEDLKQVFNQFYDLIYGTSTVTIAEDVFPENGVLETPFRIPGIGVEEVNIVINGTTSGVSLLDPDRNECSADQMSVTSKKTFTLVKLKEFVPGDWTLVTRGKPGDQIKINMVYNTNLTVDISTLENNSAASGETVSINAKLRAGDKTADSREMYSGYSAVLEIYDADSNLADTVDMAAGDGGFEAGYAFADGVWYYQAIVTGDYITKASNLIGPVTASAKQDDGQGGVQIPPENTPPVPLEDRVTATVYIWPFKGGQLTIDVSTLAKDAEDSQLKYRLVSSSFLEGKDYSFENNMLTQEHFSLSKGAYTVRATDSGGLSCDIELLVVTRNVGVMALIGIGTIALIVLIVCGILLYIALTKPFGGSIWVQACQDGTYSEKVKKEPKRGRCKLSLFGLPRFGLNYAKCYFQATGKDYIELVTDAPVYYSGRKTNRVRIESGSEATVTVDEAGAKRLYIRFESRHRGRGPRRSTGRPKQRRR